MSRRRKESPQPPRPPMATARAVAQPPLPLDGPESTGTPGVRRVIIAPAWGALLAFALGVALYAPSIGYDFTYDDTVIIKDNVRIRELGRWREYLGTSYWNRPGINREYRPLVMAAYAAQYAVTGERAWPFHLGNVVMHGLVCLAGWWLAWLMFGRPWLAGLAAVLFAVHPIHVEAVAGCVGRAELQSSLMFLLALACGLRSARAPGGRRWAWAAVAGCCAAVAIGTKENAITIAPMLALTPLFARGTGLFQAGAGPSAGRGGPVPMRLVPALLPSLVFGTAAVVLYLALRVAVLGSLTGRGSFAVTQQEMFDNPLVALSGVPRVLSAIKLLSRYAAMSFWPFNPSPDFSYGAIPLVARMFDPSWLVGAALIPLAAWCAWALRRRPASLFGIAFFAVTFIITSNIFFTIGTILAERLLYLPSYGFCLLIADLACWIGPAAQGPGRRRWIARALLGAGGLWMLALPVQALRYLPVWRNDAALFEYMAKRMPGSARANVNHGLALLNDKQPEKAAEYFRKSISIMRKVAGPHAHLGVALIRLDPPRIEEAQKEFEEALKYDPYDPTAVSGLARVHYLRDDLDAAMALYPSAIEMHKEDWGLRRDYGLLLELVGGRRKEAEKLREAVEQLELYIDRTRREDDVEVGAALARAHYRLANFQAAARHARRVLEKHPEDKTMTTILKGAGE